MAKTNPSSSNLREKAKSNASSNPSNEVAFGIPSADTPFSCYPPPSARYSTASSSRQIDIELGIPSSETGFSYYSVQQQPLAPQQPPALQPRSKCNGCGLSQTAHCAFLPSQDSATQRPLAAGEPLRNAHGIQGSGLSQNPAPDNGQDTFGAWSYHGSKYVNSTVANPAEVAIGWGQLQGGMYDVSGSTLMNQIAQAQSAGRSTGPTRYSEEAETNEYQSKGPTQTQERENNVAATANKDTMRSLEKRIAALQAAEFTPLTVSNLAQPGRSVAHDGGMFSDGPGILPLPYSYYPPPTNPVSIPASDVATRGYDEELTAQESTLFEKYKDTIQPKRGKSLIGDGLRKEESKMQSADDYAEPFIKFMTENPTIWHAIQYWEKKLDNAGFKKLSERESWNGKLEAGGKYYVTRNGTSMVAFAIGGEYKSGNGVAMIGCHSDSLTARLKPISTKSTKGGYVQLGVAPYAGGLNETWWDRDLGIGGRVLVKDEKTGAVSQKLVKLDWPIARIPTLAPHFGVGMMGQNNKETQMVPIIGLDNSDIGASNTETPNHTLGADGTFISTQPPKLVSLIASELGLKSHSSIVNWDLELFDTQPACFGGLDKEFIFAGRIDDKICSWSAIESLVASTTSTSTSFKSLSTISLVALFDNEEIGSLLRQGARGNFLPGSIERIVESYSGASHFSPNLLQQTYANSFFVSCDVSHAGNPNFLEKYLDGHVPRLNVGLSIHADSNGHTTTDAVSAAIMTRLAEKCGQKLQVFMIRNDSRSGGTIGPALSSMMGVRAVDAGISQLSMHSIRATVGRKDPGLGVLMLRGVLEHWGAVDAELVSGGGW